MRRLLRLRGVGNKTRLEIRDAVKILRELLGKPDKEQQLVPESSNSESDVVDIAALSIDLLADRLLKTGARDGDTFQRTVRLLLGIGDAVASTSETESDTASPWPSQAMIANVVGCLLYTSPSPRD